MVYAGFVIPVYNTKPEILEKTLKDLYKQTSLPIYIVDDGSNSAETVEYLRKLEGYKQIEVIHHEKTKGKIEALATGVREGNITYPFFIDDDVTIKVNPRHGSEGLDTVIEKREIKLLNDGGSCVVYPVGARNRDENVLTKIQDLEHMISTYYVRRLLNHGLTVNGTGSLWKSKDFLEIYNLHSKVHEGDDLETSLISYVLGKEIVFSDSLILLAEMKGGFRDWFKQRMIWEYGKWRLLRRYWKEILKNPNTFSYYFASPSLLLSFLYNGAGIVYTIFALCSVFSKRGYKWDNKRRVKEVLLYIPVLGLLSYMYPPILLITPIYYYLFLRYIRNRYDVSYPISLKDTFELLIYSIFYLTILQPSGIIYSIYKEMRNKQ